MSQGNDEGWGCLVVFIVVVGIGWLLFEGGKSVYGQFRGFSEGDCLEYVDRTGQLKLDTNFRRSSMRVLAKTADDAYLVEWTSTYLQNGTTDYFKTTIPGASASDGYHLVKVACPK